MVSDVFNDEEGKKRSLLSLRRTDKANEEMIKNRFGRKTDISPVFVFSNSATLAVTTGIDNIDFAEDKPEMKKYIPMNNVRVTNASSSAITVYPNQNLDHGVLIPAGAVTNIPSDIFPSISSLRYINSGASSITANQINFLVSRNNISTDILAEKFFRLLNGQSQLIKGTI